MSKFLMIRGADMLHRRSGLGWFPKRQQIWQQIYNPRVSRLHPRHVVPKRGQAYEPEVPVEVREWISPAPASSDLMLEAQPPA